MWYLEAVQLSLESVPVNYPSDDIFATGVEFSKLTIVGDIPPGTTRWYMGCTIRGGPACKIEACTARLQVVLDIVIVPNMILYL